MMLALQEFFSQWWVGASLAIVSVVVGIAGVFSYKFGVRSSKPVYQEIALRLVGGDYALPNGVEVIYNDKTVERLTKLIIVFWNDGSAVLDKNDIAESDPLKLSFDGEVLDARLLRQTKSVNQFRITLDETYNNLANIIFDYLDPKDGAVIEILHTSNRKYAKFDGSVKGLSRGIRDIGRASPGPFGKLLFDGLSSRKLFSRRMIALGLIFYLIFGIALLLSLLFPDFTYLAWLDNAFISDPDTLSAKILKFTAAIFSLGLPILYYFSFRRRYPKALVFEDFV